MGDRCPPIVMVDGGDTTVAVLALKHGAADYLVRDRMTPEDLRCAVRSAIENAKLKQKLQRSQERFQASIDTLMDCFGIFSSIRDESGKILDFRIDYLNDAACENNQMPRESQIGHGLCEILPGHRESDLFDAYCHLVETGKPVIRDSLIYEDIYRGKQRLIRAYDIRAPKLDDGFVASWRDITQRKQMELEMNEALHLLQQKQHNLDQLINTAPIGIGIGAADGSIRMVNDAMLRFHGYTREEFEREVTNWRSLVPPEAMEVTQQALEQLHQHGISPPHEKELLRRDGSRFPVWISATQWSNGTTNEHVSFVVDLTHQKQVEADLRASQQRYRDLAEAMPQIVWAADATGNITYWNQRWYEYTGLSEAASMGIEGIQTVHPDDRDRTLTHWQDCLTQKQPFEIEYRVRRWDGVYHWFIGRGVPSYNDPQQIIGWIGTLTDIDNLKRNEALISEREQQLQQQLAEIEVIYQTAPIGLNVLDRDLRFLRINQRLAEINGLSIEAHIGRTIREVLPNLVDVAEPLLRSVLETGTPLMNLEIHGETSAQPGVQRTWLEHFLPLKEGDRTIGISIVCEEITQQKQAEEALRRSEERYRTLFESMNDGFCVIQLLFDQQNTSIDYRFIEINPMFEHHTGLKDALGKTVRQILPDLEPHWFEIYGKVALTGEPIRFEHGSDVMQRWFDVSAFRIGQPEERKVALLFKETSDRKRVEQTLAQRATELSELTQRLEKNTVDLRQRNQDLGQFAYVVSHDLKAPLRGIRNLAEWFQQDLGDRIPPENQKQLHLLIGRVNHMEVLIVDLLEYCRVGQVKQAPESIATGELIQDVLHTLSIPPEIHIQITQPTPTILARRLMMRQVLTNLIGNAIKHGCPNQQGKVMITIQETPEGYQFAIADQGPGIDPKHHTKIFGIFETLKPKDRIDSTGIGLAIVKKLVEAEQGKIWVDSTLGNGATFYFTLPRYCVHTSPDFC